MPTRFRPSCLARKPVGLPRAVASPRTTGAASMMSRKQLLGAQTPLRDAWILTENGQRQWLDAMELTNLADDLPQRLSELGIMYDPEKLAALFKDRRGDLMQRALSISGSLGLFASALMRDWATSSLQRNMPKRSHQLARTLTRLGPSFVKVGQALSLRPDLMPQQYLDALTELQDRLEPFPSDIAFAVIEEELGLPLEAVYSHITPEPVAAASLGQVYKATLASTGAVVAVKVQRPGIGQSIALDMLLLRQLLAFVDSNQDILSQQLTPLVDEFARRLFGELDYVQEGKNAERFAQLYGSIPRIRVPSIYWEATSRRVLTMEWIEGVKLTDRAAMATSGKSITEFVNIGVECTLRQLLEAGYFHADPHPGNLLATPQGDLAYLDFGMMSEAPANARTAIIAHVVHLVNRDYEAMCRDYYDLDFMDRSVNTAPIAPALAAFFDNVLEASVSELNFKAIVDGLGSVLFEYPFQVPAYYALILRSLVVYEGLALSADRGYKLIAQAYPYMAQRLLTDPDPSLRATFEELVLKDGEFRWRRLTSLVRESSRTLGALPRDNLWLTVDWLLGPEAVHIRATIVEDVVRMTDALCAGAVREGVAQQSGSASLAERMVPRSASEGHYAELADELLDLVRDRFQLRSPFDRDRPADPPSLPSVPSMQAYMESVIGAVQAAAPRMQGLAFHPNVRKMVLDISTKIVQRAAARSVKFVLAGPASAAR